MSKSDHAAAPAGPLYMPFEVISGDKPRRERMRCKVDVETFNAVSKVLAAGGGPFTYHQIGKGRGKGPKRTITVALGCDGVIVDENGGTSISDIAMISETISGDETKVDWSGLWLKVAMQALGAVESGKTEGGTDAPE